MLEWLKRHAWKACIRQNRISGSNPDLSARYFTFLLKACSHCAIAPESKITFKQNTMCKTTKHFSKGVFCNKLRFSKSVLLPHRKSRNLTMSSAEEATEYLFGRSAVCIKENNRRTIAQALLTAGYQELYKGYWLS